MLTKNGHKIPDFIIGGAPRSGTTFLCHALAAHPELSIAEPFIPEPKVFIGNINSAESYFKRYDDYFHAVPSGKVLGEKSSGYFESERSCHLLKEFLPEVKLLFILREPVQRAYSNYLRSKENGLEDLPFEQAVELEGSRPCPLPPEKAYAKPHDYLIRGHYDIFAERYLKAFDRDKIGFFIFEDIQARPHQLLLEIQKFLGVSPIDPEKLNPGRINGLNHPAPDLDPRLEKKLRARMAPHVVRFHQLTGVDVSAWGYEIPAVGV